MTEQAADEEIIRLLDSAVCLYDNDQIDHAISRMANSISTDLNQSNPILLPIMNGGLTLGAALMKHMQFPLQLDYLHVTRYRESTSGGEVEWIYKPRIDLRNRTVLIIDDLLDHGITLLEARNFCLSAGASRVCTAVLIVKEIINRPGIKNVDYHALTTPDKYLFGYGMDYKSYWRNAPGIYAV